MHTSIFPDWSQDLDLVMLVCTFQLWFYDSMVLWSYDSMKLCRHYSLEHFDFWTLRAFHIPQWLLSHCKRRAGTEVLTLVWQAMNFLPWGMCSKDSIMEQHGGSWWILFQRKSVMRVLFLYFSGDIKFSLRVNNISDEYPLTDALL